MRFMSGDMSKPARIQSAYISEGEVKKVVAFIAEQYSNDLPSGIDFTKQQVDSTAIFDASIDTPEEDDDDLYEDARAIVIEAGKASTSYIQRKLRVGYARAARLMDILEERGVIGPADGSRPREVIDSSSSDSDSEEAPKTESTEDESI